MDIKIILQLKRSAMHTEMNFSDSRRNKKSKAQT